MNKELVELLDADRRMVYEVWFSTEAGDAVQELCLAHGCVCCCVELAESLAMEGTVV